MLPITNDDETTSDVLQPKYNLQCKFLKLVLFLYSLHTQQFRSKCLLLPALHDKLLTSSLIQDYWEILCLKLHSPFLNISSASKALDETAHPGKVYEVKMRTRVFWTYSPF